MKTKEKEREIEAVVAVILDAVNCRYKLIRISETKESLPPDTCL